MHRLVMSDQLTASLSEIVMQLRSALRGGGTYLAYGVVHALSELALGFDSAVRVHHQVGQARPIQTSDDHVDGRPLLGYEEHALPVGRQ